MNKPFIRLNNKSQLENNILKERIRHFNNSPIPQKKCLKICLCMLKKDLSHLIFMIELYKKIIGSHGDIFEFGTRWGRNISLFITLEVYLSHIIIQEK